MGKYQSTQWGGTVTPGYTGLVVSNNGGLVRLVNGEPASSSNEAPAVAPASTTKEAIQQAIAPAAAAQAAPVSEPVNIPQQAAATPSAAAPAVATPANPSPALVATTSPTALTPIAQMIAEAVSGTPLKDASNANKPLAWGSGGLVVDPLWNSGSGSVVS